MITCLSGWITILMGVDRFYIYDNDSQISLRASLADYIERGWVVVIDTPGRSMQLYVYDHCLQTFGSNTFWLGFIDTDEFLVPKIVNDLKELLKGYEAYGGLAVSSLFFGSNGHSERPTSGQIAAYTLRSHSTFKENELVKCIVQPRLVLMPGSPHDFLYKENACCVNEAFLRVDDQRFPNYIDKIQLNHYFCRSTSELDKKLRRGRPSTVETWPRKRFDLVDRMATYSDLLILQNLEMIFWKEGSVLFRHPTATDSQPVGLVEKMATLVRERTRAKLLPSTNTFETFNLRADFVVWMDLKAQGRLAKKREDYGQLCQVFQRLIGMQPQYPNLYVNLADCFLQLGNPDAAWQELAAAWKLAPQSYAVLQGMASFFLWMKNFAMLEKTCHLILEMAPHNLMVLGYLAEALFGQGRFEEGLHVGLPVVELSAEVGELPPGVGLFLVKKMVAYLLEKKDYPGVVRLWQAGVLCQPGDVDALVELIRALIVAGDKTGARQRLVQARELAPRNEILLDLQRQLGSPHLNRNRR